MKEAAAAAAAAAAAVAVAVAADLSPSLLLLLLLLLSSSFSSLSLSSQIPPLSWEEGEEEEGGGRRVEARKPGELEMNEDDNRYFVRGRGRSGCRQRKGNTSAADALRW